MARIEFENPNEPEQPRPGVYGWFYGIGEARTTIYIGRAGANDGAVRTPSTLYRGIQEASRSCISSAPPYDRLDTDFIVGTALRYMKELGHSCYWRHLSDIPGEEKAHWHSNLPLLQPTSTSISPVFRPKKQDGTAWCKSDVALAEQLLFRAFSENFKIAT